VHDDGIIGRGTLTAVFKKLGASQARAEELGLAANVHLRTLAFWTTRFALSTSLHSLHMSLATSATWKKSHLVPRMKAERI
jgi:lysozyme family protein